VDCCGGELPTYAIVLAGGRVGRRRVSWEYTMTDSQIRAWLDQEDMMVANMIRAHGWYIQYVMGDPAERTTSIAYTIGLFGIGHPELVLLGSSPGTASGVLNDVGGRVKAGETLVQDSCSRSRNGRIASPSRRCRTPATSCSEPTGTTSAPTKPRCRHSS
jgi:hypothetical protein